MIERGDVVEVGDAGYPEWAWVIGTHGPKVAVQGPCGRQRTLRRTALGWRVPGAHVLGNEALHAFLDAVDALVPKVMDAAPELWALARASHISAPDALWEAWSTRPEGSPPEVGACAVCTALRDEAVYFTWENGTLLPVEETEVARRLERRAQMSWRQRAREALIEELGAVLREGKAPDALRDLLEQSHPGEFGVTWAQRLIQVAAGAASDEVSRQVDDLLDTVEDATDRTLPSWPSRAYGLLVLAGIFHPLENLARWRHGWPGAFEPEVCAWAEARVSARGGQGVFPLLDREVVTIDGDETQDFDDAFSVAARPDGGVEIGIHIAHPPALFSLRDPVGQAALARGTSLYLPEEEVPMLPPAAVHALALVEGFRRPTLSLFLELDASMQVEATRWERCDVEVAANLRWSDVARRLESPGTDATTESVRQLYWCALALEQQRREAGGVLLELPEVRFRARGEQPVVCEHYAWDHPARRLVAELMIYFNGQMGARCREMHLDALYRVQPRPQLPAAAREWQEHPDRMAGAHRLLRFMRRAHWSREPGAHGGLGVPAYVQASSPLRRMPDWLAHLSLSAHLEGRERTEDERLAPEELEALLERLDAADAIGREAHVRWGLHWLEREGDALLEAMALDEAPAGRHRIQVVLVRTLQRAELVVRGPVAFGDRLGVKVDAVDAWREQITLRLA